VSGTATYTLTVKALATIASISVSAPTSGQRTGDIVMVSIQAFDRYDNLANYNGTVTLSSSNTQIFSSTTVTLTNGQATTTLNAGHSGTVTLTASADSTQSSAVTITIAPSLWTYTWAFVALDVNRREISGTYSTYTNTFGNSGLAGADADAWQVAVYLPWLNANRVNWYAINAGLIDVTAAN
jgi:hypothetical protein